MARPGSLSRSKLKHSFASNATGSRSMISSISTSNLGTTMSPRSTSDS
jgi:hypothetical protein